MLGLQKEENQLRKEEVKSDIELAKQDREERMKQMQLSFEERSCTTKLLQKMVERICPEEDPAEHYVARKRKLDDLREALGDELYDIKLQQLKDEFKKLQQCSHFMCLMWYKILKHNNVLNSRKLCALN